MGRLLTKQERKLLEKELRLERYARFSDRIKCILLLDAGKSPESIAEYLFLSRNTAINYLKRYQIERLWRFQKKLSYTIGTMSGLLISRERF
jgi:transcriptional antiterminator